MTTVFDAAGEGSAKACWVLMRRAKRTGLSPQALPRNLRGFSQLPVTAPKNRTRIGPHHGRRKVSLFSPKTGYVRRSEIGRCFLGRPEPGRRAGTAQVGQAPDDCSALPAPTRSADHRCREAADCLSLPVHRSVAEPR